MKYQKFNFTKLILLLTVSISLFASSYTHAAGKTNKYPTYEASWDSLNQHETPEWLLDAKFGIYGHWGIYSIPAFKTEWYGRLMYDKQTRGEEVFNHHIEKYGKQSEFGYKDFIPMFKAEKYNPDEWAELITSSGAKYAGITVVHHDGYCLWDSEFTRWDSMDTGPKRDIYGELVSSLRKADSDFKILTCFHHFRTYGWFNTKDKELLEQGRKEGWDIFDPEYADLYWNPELMSKQKFLTQWTSKIKEVIDNYQPDVIWFDGGGFSKGENEAPTLDVLSYFYNTQNKKGSEVLVVNKKSNFHPDFGLKNFEKGGNRPPKVDFDWADDLNVATRGWCYTYNINYRTANQIVDGFVDRVSRGGALMLSISPKGDGSIPDEQQHILREMGKWLKQNGEGIYGTRRWKIETEGPVEKFLDDTGAKIMWDFKGKGDSGDIRFTKKGNDLFAFALDWPKDSKLIIKSLNTNEVISSKNEISKIAMLDTKKKLKWSRDENGLTVVLPKQKHCDYAVGIKIQVKGKLAE
ncbi:MAG: alpha-L-fucosidase [Phycisphaerae bacterium]|nr:alpha-L-fucosidase [Phycisphaerae bacterium]